MDRIASVIRFPTVSCSRLPRKTRTPACALAAIFLGTVLGLGHGSQVVAEPDVQRRLPGRVDRAALMDVVRTLSSRDFEGRAAGTPGGVRARTFVVRRFEAIGLKPLAEAGSFVYPVDPTVVPLPKDRARLNRRDAANVVGFVKGTRNGASAIMVSAHYDHLGTADGVVYPGADDNASGVAVLLAAASHLVKHPPRHDVVFVAFDAEELNLAGSTAFVARPPMPLGRIRLIVNLDMVSRSDRRTIVAAGTSHHPALRPLLEGVRRRAPVQVSFGHDRAEEGADDWTQDSDHWPFHKAGVPFVYFGVEDHPDYHRPSDTPDRIDMTFFGGVADTIVETLIAFDAGLD